MNKIPRWQAWAFILTLLFVAILINARHAFLRPDRPIGLFESLARDNARRNETESAPFTDITVTAEFQGIEVPIGMQSTFATIDKNMTIEIRVNRDPGRTQEMLPPNSPEFHNIQLGDDVAFIELRVPPNQHATTCKVRYWLKKA